MIRYQRARVNGLDMHYAEAGEENGELVLLLHGFPEYCGVWSRVLDALSSSYHVVAPDQRGANETSRPPALESYRMPALVEDVRALADHLGHERFCLVGQDWGAIVAWSFAMQHPERLRRMVVISVSHPALFDQALRTSEKQQAASQYMFAFRGPDGETILSDGDFGMLRELYGPVVAAGLATQDDLEAHVAALKKPGALTAGLNWYRAAQIGPPDGAGHPGGSNVLDGVSPEAMIVQTPTLLLFGEKDPYVLPETVQGLDRYAPNTTPEIVPGGGHFLTLTNPELVVSRVRSFFAAG